jgi:hypothetical protein
MIRAYEVLLEKLEETQQLENIDLDLKINVCVCIIAKVLLSACPSRFLPNGAS